MEQRGQSLDTGLARLSALLSELAPRPLPELCDALLERLVSDHPEDVVPPSSPSGCTARTSRGPRTPHRRSCRRALPPEPAANS